MKSGLYLSILVICCLVFSGCPYESKVPIDKPAIRINKAFLGSWVMENDEYNTIEITPVNDFIYYIVTISKGDTASANMYYGYMSDISNTTFINLWKSDEVVKKYMIYKIDFSTEGRFTFTGVSENVDEQFTNSEELKTFITHNMKNSYFFEKEEGVYVKK